jgi:hypothetical protein
MKIGKDYRERILYWLAERKALREDNLFQLRTVSTQFRARLELIFCLTE